MRGHGFSFAIPALTLCGCISSTIYHTTGYARAPVHTERLLNSALTWPAPSRFDALKGAVLLRDGAPLTPSQPELAIARAILHTNPRLAAADALLFAGTTVHAARANALAPEFLGAAILQESAYDAQAFSAAGAIGIAQFMPETAAGLGVDPYDPLDAIRGAAALLGGYVAQYGDRYGDPYVTALAAYNAGPGAVERYRGVPPYAETRDYVATILDRWARIVSYERIGGVSGGAWKRSAR